MSMDPISYTASLLIDLKEATRSKKLVTMLKETQRWLDSHINVVVAGRSSAPEQNLVEWLVGTARPAMNNHGVVSFSPSNTHTTLAWNQTRNDGFRTPQRRSKGSNPRRSKDGGCVRLL